MIRIWDFSIQYAIPLLLIFIMYSITVCHLITPKNAIQNDEQLRETLELKKVKTNFDFLTI